MALIVKDRVKQQTTTTGTGTYTLSGSFDGFQTFAEIGDGNTTYYACTDGTDFEIGIGTFTASGTTLARTTILQSSNSDAAVNWTSGTRTIFCTQPAEKAVFLNADGDIEFDNSHRIKLTSNGNDPVIAIAGGGPNFIRFHDAVGFNSADNAVDIVYRTTPNDLLIERGGNDIASFGGDDGHAALYYNNSKKLETVSGGIDVTGQIAATSLDISGDVDVDGTLEADAMTLNGTAITATATLSTGISNNNVPKFTSGVADNDFLRVDGTAIEGRSASEVLSDIAAMPLAGGTFIGNVTLQNAGDVTLTLEADTDNATESDNPSLVLSQDGGGTVSSLKLGSGNSTILEASDKGSLILRSTNGDDFLVGNQNAGVELFYDDSKKLETHSDGISVLSTENNGPVINLISNDPADVADFTTEAQIKFFAENDASEITQYATIFLSTGDVTDGTEDGWMYFQTMHNGSLTNTAAVSPDSFYLLQPASTFYFNDVASSGYHTAIRPATPTNNRTITLPDATGQVVLSDGAIDTEASAEIGRAHIGAMGHSDFAGFSHIDQNGTGSYALLQHSGGGTHLNAASGNSINFNINNLNVMNMDDAGLYFYSGKVILFEGSTDSTNETTLTVADPTADRTITLPDDTGTVALNEQLEGDATNGAGLKSRELVSRGVIATGTGCVSSRRAFSNQTITAGNPNGWFFVNNTILADYLYALPITVPGEDEGTTTNISEFIFTIGTSSPTANTTIGMGLYTLNKYGMPSQRVSHGTAAITTSTAADAAISITPDVTAITPGRYAMCISNLGASVGNIAFNFRNGAGTTSFVDGFGSVTRGATAVSLFWTGQTATSMPTSLAGVTSAWTGSFVAPFMDLFMGTAYSGE